MRTSKEVPRVNHVPGEAFRRWALASVIVACGAVVAMPDGQAQRGRQTAFPLGEGPWV